MNKLGRGTLGDAINHISRLYALRFQTRRFFNVFPYISKCKICDHQRRAIFSPRGITQKVLLHTKYHGSTPNGFRQEDFFMFLPIYVYVEHVTPPPPGWGHFWPQGYNLNKFVRDPQGDATYQLSKL